MFQIFAARMFEQRVLTAYREKVAKERQEKLLEELADESRLDAQREAKRAKEAQKKKERKKQQKAAKEEERQRREAEKAAEEAAIKAAEEKKQEEQRRKKEEQRKRKEAEKKAQEEERFRKEAEKARRAQELKDQQAENERKQREQRDKEKRRKEEAKLKEREEREAKEKELQGRKVKEAADKREREAKARVERDARDKARKDENKHAAQPVPAVPPLPRKPSVIVPPIPPGLQASTSNHASPHLPVATPALPKAPTSAKPRQPSNGDTLQFSPKTVSAQSGSSAASPSSSQQNTASSVTSLSAKLPNVTAGPPPLHNAQPPVGPPPGAPQFPFGSPPGIAGPGFAPSYAGPMQGNLPRNSPHDTLGFGHPQPYAMQQRGFQPPAGLGYPPGINGLRVMTQGPAAPVNAPPPHGPIGGANATNTWVPPASHSRHASYEKLGFDGPAPPPGAIGRPAPIQRPSSLPHSDEQNDVDELSSHLGSSALLGDDDGPALGTGSARSVAPGSQRPGHAMYAVPSAFPPSMGSSKMESFSPRQSQNGGPSWGAPQPQTPMNPSSWSPGPTAGWGAHSQFGAIGIPGRAPARPITLRLLACQACRQLNASNPVKNGGGGFHHVDQIVRLVDQLRPANEPVVNKNELLEILETEGNGQNGGGNFAFQSHPQQGTFVKYEFDPMGSYAPRAAVHGAPGQIGSPVGTASLPFGRGFAPPTPSGF